MQAMVKEVVETLRVVVGCPEDVQSAVMVLQRLANDPESSIRTEVMEQVPHIAVFCKEFSHELGYIIPQHLVPLVLTCFTDSNDQVRKTSQAALLVLSEQALIDRNVIKEKVCPIIFLLIKPDTSENQRTEGVALMIKLAPILGRELSKTIFLDYFCTLCTDPLHIVRKVCAANFGDFCSIFNHELVEQILLPKFFYLCEDNVWEVRKECTAIFMTVSCACSLPTRRRELAVVFFNLICDTSYWVRVTAFESLGPFISTFADPEITGLYYKEGDLVRVEKRVRKRSGSNNRHLELSSRPNIVTNTSPKKCEEPKAEPDTPTETQEPTNQCSTPSEAKETKVKAEEGPAVIDNAQSAEEKEVGGVSMDLSNDNDGLQTCIYNLKNSLGEEISPEEKLANRVMSREETSQSYFDISGLLLVYEKSANLSSDEDDSSEQFDTFNYWRDPIPVIELEDLATEKDDFPDPLVFSFQHIDLNDESDGKESSDSKGAYKTITADNNGESSQTDKSINVSWCKPSIGFNYADFFESPTSSPTRSRSPVGHTNLQYNSIVLQQDIIPYDLLNAYLNMTDQNLVNCLDSCITRKCAYSISAVVLTLGQDNWHCIKDTYEALSTDLKWKVRYTLASSIHDVAYILGEEITTRDLHPIFSEFIKDLDEVRIGILNHLSDFLKILKEEVRREYLPMLAEFIKIDNILNWRFRHELAHQFMTVPDLFSPAEVKEYIVPIALCLVNDKVSEVRKQAYQCMAVILKRLCEHEELVRPILYDLTNQFCQSSRWVRRQIYAILCQNLLIFNSVSMSLYTMEVLPHLLHLSWDPVPNVRIAVAQCVSQNILKSAHLCNPEMKYHDYLMEAVRMLQYDTDRDVYFIANEGKFNEIIHN